MKYCQPKILTQSQKCSQGYNDLIPIAKHSDQSFRLKVRDISDNTCDDGIFLTERAAQGGLQ